ncbi:uncharacterized protein RCO7_07624 [Rhynchosporium graminicola]|uniref:Uncharacterized protein n=1 Tax=Rhynchosporium graminicola TaxID=2792576 RepID=A0A1E1KZI7_9HELO|nr:uncharacterized protein RCO7_07624 [Rhynchosporium commune]
MFHSYQAVNTTAQPKPPVRWVSAGATLLPLYAFTLSVAMQSARIYNQVSETDASVSGVLSRPHVRAIAEFDIVQSLILVPLEEYICACGKTADSEKAVSCKICMCTCSRYTLNRFDVIHEDGNQPVVVMQSSQRVKGGGEGKEDWKSGECLYFYQRLEQ